MSVRIPADVDMRDRVLGPLTARQLSILAVTGLVLYAVWLGSRVWVPVPVFLALAAPLAAASAVLALGRRDGISLDRLMAAAIRQRTGPRVLVAAPEGIAPVPDWLTDHADTISPTPPSPVRLPAEAITSVGAGIGVIDLRGEGLAMVAACSTVNFALQTPAEQEGLVAVFARYLHSLTAATQVLVRTERLDLSGQITELRDTATGLPDPALEAAAIEHADYLEQLGRHSDLLRRHVLLVLREPLTATGPSDGLGGPSAWAVLSWVARGRRRAATAPTGEGSPARKAAEARLLRRLGEAAELLGPAGITVTGLDAARATAVLASACNPGTLLAPSARIVAAGDVVTRSPDRHRDTSHDDSGHTSPVRGSRIRGRRRRAAATPRTAAAFVPEALAIGPRHVEVGGEWVASFAVTGFPREVRPGWLSPLTSAYPGRLDVAVHVVPIDPATAADRLRKQLARLESGRVHSAEHGRLSDPLVEVATEDAYDLSDRVARGEGKLFRVGLYLTVHARTEAALADDVAALRALTSSLLLDIKHTTYRSVAGWVTASLPMGLDLIGMTRTFDTAALAAAFPFTSPDLPAADPTAMAAPAGVLYGYNTGSQALVHWDRFAATMHNHNSVILGRSGAGKSYLVKLELLRSLYRGVQAFVIDPEDEYARLADAVGGTYLRLGSGVRLNPFDLPIYTHSDGTRTAPPDALLRRTLFCHTVIAVLLGGEPTPAQRAAIDVAIAAAYRSVGITDDPDTWTRPAPTLRTLRQELAAAGHAGDDTAAEVAARLHPYVDGAFSQLFDGPTTIEPDGHLVVFSLRDLPEELATIGTLLTLDAVWRRVTDPAHRRPRLVVVDEAWLLMQQPAGAQFLLRTAKSARKHWAGLTVATQDTADVLGSDLGKAVVANAATQILLRQAPQAADEVTRTFDLSAGERQFLLSADKGEGLLSAGTQRVTFHAIASPTEHYLVTSNPAELANAATDFGTDPSYTDLDTGSPL